MDGLGAFLIGKMQKVEMNISWNICSNIFIITFIPIYSIKYFRFVKKYNSAYSALFSADSALHSSYSAKFSSNSQN